MILRIDGAGRVVLPKLVRDRLGLRSGSMIELLETREGIVLKPVSRRPSLVRAGRFLVHTGKLPAGFDILKSTANRRDEHFRKTAGLAKPGRSSSR